MNTARTQQWDIPTEPVDLDCPVVREHMERQSQEFRAAMARIAPAVHPDDTMPADLYELANGQTVVIPPHIRDLGRDPLHDHPAMFALGLVLLSGLIVWGLL